MGRGTVSKIMFRLELFTHLSERDTTLKQFQRHWLHCNEMPSTCEKAKKNLSKPGVSRQFKYLKILETDIYILSEELELKLSQYS